MPTPNLIHPIKITFEIMDRSNSVFDQYAREPVGQVIRQGESEGTGTRIVIKGQVSYYFAGAKQDEPQFAAGGVEEGTVGYISLRFKDMIKVGLATITDGKYVMTLKRGDRIVQMGKRGVDLYVGGFKDFAHYPTLDQTMLQVNFMDRHPGYQQGDL